MQVIQRGDVQFELPAWFNLDDDAKQEVFRDGYRHHAVRLDVTESDGDEARWLDERYAGAERWSETIDGRELHFATKVGKKLRVTVSVIAAAGKVYELACTSDDPSKPRPDLTCTTIVRSLRMRGAAKPSGSTI